MSSNLIDQAAQSANSAVRSTQHAGEQASTLVRNGMDAAREASRHASRRTVAYIHDEPVKSMLMAAATGAALTALVWAIGQSSKAR